MCLSLFNKWRDFQPTEKYLSIITNLNSVSKLHKYSQRFKYIAEKKDKWKTPVEFMNDGSGDCEDWARWYVDVLVRIIKIDEARFVIHSGYNKARWGNKIWNVKCHAICVFEWQGKFGVFSNNQLYTGIDSYEDAGKIIFKDGLKYQEVYNYKGEVLEKRLKIIGTF